MSRQAKWVQFTKRTNDPKLEWLQAALTKAGIANRRYGRSFWAPIMQVKPQDLERASAILDPVDDIPDNDPQFSKAGGAQ